MKRGQNEELAKIEERDPPPRHHHAGSWVRSLEPLLQAPGRWFMIRACNTPEQASDAQSNLTSRKVNIPQPDHDWTFAARGTELFAIYHGKKRAYVEPIQSAGRAKSRRKAS